MFVDLTILVVFLEFIVLVFALKNYFKYKKSEEKYFLFFLFFTLFTEFVGLYTTYVLKINFIIIYNIYIIVSYLFYFYWYFAILYSERQRKTILSLTIVFLVFSLYNFFTIKHVNFHSSTFVLGAIINICAILFFFSQLLNDKKEIEVKHNLKFWISTGLLLFNVGMIPLMLFSEQFNSHNSVRVFVLLVLNFILYSCYSIGFNLCKQPVEK